MKLDKITYRRGNPSKEWQEVSMEVNPNLTIIEYKRACRRMASMLGYSNSSIEEYFGEEPKHDKNQLQLLFD